MSHYNSSANICFLSKIEMRLVDDVWTHQPRPQKNYRGPIASVLPCKIEDILHIRKLLRVHQKRSKGKIQAKSKSKPQVIKK